MQGRMVVVGASVATTALLERLREFGFPELVTVVDHDLDAPYDRPPLSKQYLTEGAESISIAVDWSELGAEVHRAEATEVDTANKHLHVRSVLTGEASTLPFDHLVLACGAIPVRLPFEPESTTVLRHACESRNLRNQLTNSARIIIIGAGAIGAELASSLQVLGADVTVLDRAPGPLERLLGGYLQVEITSWLEELGVTTRWNVGIQRIEHGDSGWEVELDGQEILRSDLVISAVGAKPAVEWLPNLLSDGALVVDDCGRVIVGGSPADGLYAIGDVASRLDKNGALSRTESWSAAREQGERLADHFLGRKTDPPSLPYFWTDVAGRKVQVLGRLTSNGALTLDYSNPERGVFLYRVENPGLADAWIGVNAQPKIAQLMIPATA